MAVQSGVTIPIVLLAVQDTSCNHLPRPAAQIVRMGIMKILQHILVISVILLVQYVVTVRLLLARPAMLVITFSLHRRPPHVPTPVQPGGRETVLLTFASVSNFKIPFALNILKYLQVVMCPVMAVRLEMIIPIVPLVALVTSCSHLPQHAYQVVLLDTIKIHQLIPVLCVMVLVRLAQVLEMHYVGLAILVTIYSHPLIRQLVSHPVQMGTTKIPRHILAIVAMVLVLHAQAQEMRCVGLAILAITYNHHLIRQLVCRLAQVLAAISQMGLQTTVTV